MSAARRRMIRISSDGDVMSKLDDWADKQWAGMKHGLTTIGTDIVADVGNTYQAFLMSDAGWRVPRADHDFTMDDNATASIAQQAETAEVEAAVADVPHGPEHDTEPDFSI